MAPWRAAAHDLDPAFPPSVDLGSADWRAACRAPDGDAPVRPAAAVNPVLTPPAEPPCRFKDRIPGLTLNVLGLSGALTRDPSTALYIDSKLVAAAEGKRFVTRQARQDRMPMGRPGSASSLPG